MKVAVVLKQSGLADRRSHDAHRHVTSPYLDRSNLHKHLCVRIFFLCLTHNYGYVYFRNQEHGALSRLSPVTKLKRAHLTADDDLPRDGIPMPKEGCRKFHTVSARSRPPALRSDTCPRVLFGLLCSACARRMLGKGMVS